MPSVAADRGGKLVKPTAGVEPVKAEEREIGYIPAFEELFDFDGKRWRYYVYYGGRDAAKSWTVAMALLLAAQREPLRILCTREIQKTLADSVYRLLVDTIDAMGWAKEFDVTKEGITCLRTGATFIFHGLRDMSVDNVKSFEGIDIVWVEEAHRVTKRSWTVLINTIRAPQSEIWVTFNPELDTDETYLRFVESPPEDALVRKVGFEDNPYASEVLVKERERMRVNDPEEYRVVYGGQPRSVLPGAVYAREVADMVQGQRYRPVPYDPRLLVHTIWDFGWNDQTTVIFAQRLSSEVRVIDYEEGSFLRVDEWGRIVIDKPYAYGEHWMPHDAAAERLEGGGVSLQMQFAPVLRKKPKVIPRTQDVEIPVRAARAMWPRVYINNDGKEKRPRDDGQQDPNRISGCWRLLECLKRFRRAVPVTTNEPGHLVKDEYRHGADAFAQMALIVDKMTNEIERPKIIVPVRRLANPRLGY